MNEKLSQLVLNTNYYFFFPLKLVLVLVLLMGLCFTQISLYSLRLVVSPLNTSNSQFICVHT